MSFFKRLPSIVLVIFFFLVKCGEAEKNTESKNVQPEAGDHVKSAEIWSYKDWMKDPVPLISAHRGGPYPGFPENAIETFANVADQISPIVIECDIAMTKDSVLVLMHDQTLDRTTTGSGRVSETTFDELQQLFLLDNAGDTTKFKIPTLEKVLQWGKGRILFTLDVKRGVPFEMVLDRVKESNAVASAAIITYSIQDAKLVNMINPDVVISVSAGDAAAIDQIIGSGLSPDNLLAFVGVREPEASHYQKLDSLGIKTILGTLGNLDRSAEAKGNDQVYLKYMENGADIIATDRPLEVANVLKAVRKEEVKTEY